MILLLYFIELIKFFLHLKVSENVLSSRLSPQSLFKVSLNEKVQKILAPQPLGSSLKEYSLAKSFPLQIVGFLQG